MKKQRIRAIHLQDALKTLADHQPHDLKIWKLSTGDILEYKGVKYLGEWKRAGLQRVKFPQSKEIRAFRNVSLIEIDGMKVFY